MSSVFQDVFGYFNSQYSGILMLLQCRISLQKWRLDPAKPEGRQISSSTQKGLRIKAMIIKMQLRMITISPAGAKTQVQYSHSGRAAHCAAQPSQFLNCDHFEMRPPHFSCFTKPHSEILDVAW